MGPLAGTASVVQLDKTGVLSFVLVPEIAGYVILPVGGRAAASSSKRRGELREGVTIMTSYACIDVAIAEDPALTPETPLRPPKHSRSVWVYYESTRRLGFGGGGFFQSDWAAYPSEVEFPLPGYATIDAGISYRFAGRLLARLNVRNLLDERYYLSGAGSRIGYPPRSAQLSVVVGF